MNDKQQLRARMRQRRRDHVAALPSSTMALILMRPPAPIVSLVPEGATVGLYHARNGEAPTAGYARWLHENGRSVALPWFAGRSEPMEFRHWSNPFAEDLVDGPFGPQLDSQSSPAVPDVLFVPLLAFTETCERLGQGGGHYDRWLGANPAKTAIGLAWDIQLLDSLPLEPHDRPLAAVVTPTRIFRSSS